MKLLIGLGNVGAQYAHTRHNIGFMVANEVASHLGATWRTEAKLKAQIATTSFTNAQDETEKLLLAKPTTMMNLSGEAARRLVDFYKIDPTDVWAIFDDVDVPFGRLRLRSTGSSGGGHQGVNSLIRHLGSNFTRVRVGISLNDRTRESSEVYVLKPFNTEERTQLPQIVTHSANLILNQLARNQPDDTTFSLI